MAPHLASIGGPITCTGVDSALLNEQGYVILRGVLQGAELEAVRDAYETWSSARSTAGTRKIPQATVGGGPPAPSPG